jgi:hypothetical protein
MVAVSTVSPGEILNWNGQRADARQNLLSQKANGLYQRHLGQMQYANDLKGLGRRFDQARTNLPTGFIQRGTLQSGLYKDALQRYAQERLGALNDLQLRHQSSQGGMVLQDRGFEDVYAAALQRILGEQYARQASTASGVGGWV